MTATRAKSGRARTGLPVALAVVLAACSTQGGRMPQDIPFVLEGVANVERMAELTGPGSPNRTDRFRIAGTDLGSMFEAGGRVWFVFGDTFGTREPGFTRGGGEEWRSNALGYTTDTDPADGIRLDGFIVDERGWAKELLSSEKIDYSEMTVIPTYGSTANTAMYLAYMSVRHWGEPGEWEVNHSGLGKSTDGGQTWTKLEAPRWSGESNFVQVSVVKVDTDLYFWGVTHGRFGGVQLMKVHLSRWLMTYTNGGGGGASIREGVNPWGPWGEAITLVSSADVPGLYSPYMLPRYVADGGRTIYFHLSVGDPYNVFWYRADLVGKA